MKMRPYINYVSFIAIQIDPPLTNIKSPDTPELFPGIPITLQLIGRTLEEEAVIGMTEVVDAALKKYTAENNIPR